MHLHAAHLHNFNRSFFAYFQPLIFFFSVLHTPSLSYQISSLYNQHVIYLCLIIHLYKQFKSVLQHPPYLPPSFDLRYLSQTPTIKSNFSFSSMVFFKTLTFTFFVCSSFAVLTAFSTKVHIKSSKALPNATGVACATFPISSSLCISFLILADGKCVLIRL